MGWSTTKKKKKKKEKKKKEEEEGGAASSATVAGQHHEAPQANRSPSQVAFSSSCNNKQVVMEASVSGSSAPPKRRVMVVADPGRESAGALQWALTHAVLEHDELVLLHVELPNPRRGPFSVFLRRPYPGGASVGASCASTEGAGGGNYEFLDEMRARCRQAQPRVQVQVARVEMEDNDKATTILSQTSALGVDLLVIGQPRRSSFLGGRLGGGMSSKSMDMVEYLIENSKCLCVGVQKKGQNAGYVLNTKTHKNFWLLA